LTIREPPWLTKQSVNIESTNVTVTVRTSRAVQADRRRDELLAAALTLFAERGVRGTTIADIADATGSAHGLVYHYFASKDDLLKGVLERYAFVSELGALLAGAHSRPAEDVLPEVATAFSHALDDRTDLLRLVIAESRRQPVVAKALAHVTQEGERLLVDYLRSRIDAGELRPHDPTVPARALFWAVITQHLVQPEPNEFARDLAVTLLEGIRAR
jgi:AcrR family transcriptional regulator